MPIVEDVIKKQSIEALQSAIRKSKNALVKMKQKSSNTTLLEKRLQALQVGLAVLEKELFGKPHEYNGLALEIARGILTGIIHSIEATEEKIVQGSPQSTLIQRRIKAIELANAFMLASALEPTAEKPNDKGPFYHGTKADLQVGDLISTQYKSNYGDENKANYVYFTATLDAAIWGAELAVGQGRERIYEVEPLELFENDPNLTDKKFPGNPTRSYRSKGALKIIGEVTEWKGHSPEMLKQMKDHIEALKDLGIKAIEE